MIGNLGGGGHRDPVYKLDWLDNDQIDKLV